MISNDTIYIISLVIAFLSGFLFEFLLKVVSRHYDDYRDRVVRKRIVRGDLSSLISQFCDIWEDREYMIPHVNLRKDLIDRIKNIRETVRATEADLSEDVVSQIRRISTDFLELAKKELQENDEVWSEHVKEDVDRLCKSFKDLKIR